VLVCPVWPYTELAAKDNFLKGDDGRRDLSRGYLPGYHLLNVCEIGGAEMEHRVVDFRNVYGIGLEALKRIVLEKGSRLRLLPPYREHLSQAFARFFMRVGLPIDAAEIPKSH